MRRARAGATGGRIGAAALAALLGLLALAPAARAGALAAPQDGASPEPDAALADEIAAIEVERSRDPDAPELLARYAAALGAAGDADAEAAYLLLACDGIERAGGDDLAARAALKAHDKRLAALDARLARLDGHVDAYVKELAEVLRLYARNQKKPRNAVDVAGAILRRRPGHELALSMVDEIARDRPEAAADVRRLRAALEADRPRTFQLGWAAQHATWERAGRVTTPHYDVRCDVGYDVMHRVALLMEEAAAAYEAFYGVPHAPAGPTPVNVYRNLEEFQARAGQESVLQVPAERIAHLDGRREWSEGSDGMRVDPTFEFTVHVRDPREEGLPLRELESELLREAARQYGEVASGAFAMPVWLDVGCSGWFDGAELDAEGALRGGRVVPLRIEWLNHLLLARGPGAPDDMHERAARNAVPLLRTALERRPEDAKSGVDYAVDWGLVRFLATERDEQGDRPFRPCLQAAWRAAAAGVESGATVFEQAVLEPNGLTLEAFARRWSQAMLELIDAQSDPGATARELVGLGERWADEGREEAASEAFLEALVLEPGGVRARLGLARLRAGSKDKADADLTLLRARRAHRAAIAAGDEQRAEEARKLAQGADGSGFKRLLAAEEAYRDRVAAVVEAERAEGRPRTALAIARLYLDDVLGDRAADALAARLAADGQRVSRTLSLFDGVSLDGLLCPPVGVAPDGGELLLGAERPGRVTVVTDRPVAPCSRLEGQVWLVHANTVLGLTMRGPALGLRGVVLRPADDDEQPVGRPPMRYRPFDDLDYGQMADLTERLDEARMRSTLDVGPPRDAAAPLRPGRWVAFALDRSDPGSLSLRLDGREVARWPVPDALEPVQPGLIVYGGSARVRQLRVVEFDRL